MEQLQLKWKKNKNYDSTEATIYALGTVRILPHSSEDKMTIQYDFIDCQFSQDWAKRPMEEMKQMVEGQLWGILIGAFRDLQKLKKIMKSDF